MKILAITNVPSPYRVDFFNELGKYCELTVVFEKKRSNERDVSWEKRNFINFHGEYINGISCGTDIAICFSVIRYLKKHQFDSVICTNFVDPTVLLAIQYLRRHKQHYCLETDGGKALPGTEWKDKLKKYIVKGANLYFSSGKCADDYFLLYGANRQCIRWYPFTSIRQGDVLSNSLSRKEKNIFRTELGLTEDCIVISVGRFSYQNGYGKGYDTLLKVAEKTPKNIGFYIIGDEPTEEFVRWKEEKKLYHVHFLPFKGKAELFRYYQAADLSVLLSRGEAWGLVVNESMANGTPVITTDACVAGVELIKSGENGFIVGVDDVDTVTKLVGEICNDDILQSRLAENALKTIKPYTIENMAKTHMDALYRFDGR